MTALYKILTHAIVAAMLMSFGLRAASAEPSNPPLLEFNIHAKSMEDALTQYGAATGLQVLFRRAAVEGKVAPTVVGTLGKEEALERLLAESGLEYEFVNHRTLRISAIGAESAWLDTTGEKSERALSIARAQSESPVLEASDQNQADRSNSVEAEESGAKLEEVIVTAQKREERLQKVPMSISVLSGRELDRSTAEGISEALNAVPGVATQQNYLGGGTVVVVRGVAPGFSQITGSSPVAYYLDSVPFGMVKSAIAPDANAYDMQRVEVLRGPQGTLYGASALNGVVRVLTHDAELSGFDVKTRLSASSTNRGGANYRGDFAVNVPIVENKLAMRVVGGIQDLSGWIDQPNKEDANDAEIRNMRLKINAQPNDKLALALSAWSSRSDYGGPPIGFAFDKNASVLEQPMSTDYDAYGATIQYEFPAFSLSSSTSYLDYSNAGTLGLDVAPFGIAGSLYFTGEDSNVFSEEIHLNSADEGLWRWSAGAMFRRATEVRDTVFTAFPFPVPRQVSDSVSKSYAAFGELTRLFRDGAFEFTVGLRHFHDEITQDTKLDGTPTPRAETVAKANTPRGILTWHVNDRQMLYLSYSEGFRSGFAQDISVPADAGIPAAAPDRLRNYEIGAKGNLADGRLAYDASMYFMDWRDIQQGLSVFSTIYNQYTSAVVNSEAASGVGFDLGLAFEPVTDLTLSTNVSWNDLALDSDVLSAGRVLFSEGDRPNSSPETTLSASADHAFALGSQGYRGRLSASANYTSVQAYRGLGNVNDIVIQKGDPITLARASFSVESPNRWKATLYGDNLNNERGAPVRAFVGAPNWDAHVRPRTVGLQVEYDFK